MLSKQRGTVLISIVGIATLWLVATGNLSLFIHPRYNQFATVMSLVGILGVVLSFSMSKKGKGGNAVITLAIIAATGISLLVLKPTTLSSDIANVRGVNSGIEADQKLDISSLNTYSPFENSDFTQLNVKDLANILSSVKDADFYEGKDVEAVGFITKHEKNNYFFVSRFVMSCCAVDSRPVGITVYEPGWQNSLGQNQWVRVKGEFIERDQEIVLNPSSIEKIKTPKDPYVY